MTLIPKPPAPCWSDGSGVHFSGQFFPFPEIKAYRVEFNPLALLGVMCCWGGVGLISIPLPDTPANLPYRIAAAIVWLLISTPPGYYLYTRMLRLTLWTDARQVSSLIRTHEHLDTLWSSSIAYSDSALSISPSTALPSPTVSSQRRTVTIERTSKWIKFFMVAFGLGFPLCVIGAFALSGFAQTLSILGIFFCPVAFLITKGPVRWWFHG